MQSLQAISKTWRASAGNDLPHKTSEPVLVFAPSKLGLSSLCLQPSTSRRLFKMALRLRMAGTVRFNFRAIKTLSIFESNSAKSCASSAGVHGRPLGRGPSFILLSPSARALQATHKRGNRVPRAAGPQPADRVRWRRARCATTRSIRLRLIGLCDQARRFAPGGFFFWARRGYHLIRQCNASAALLPLVLTPPLRPCRRGLFISPSAGRGILPSCPGRFLPRSFLT